MTKSKLSKSIRKYIRLEKRKIRSKFLNEEEIEKAINALYKKEKK